MAVSKYTIDKDILLHTPLIPYAGDYENKKNCTIYLKPENLQVFGSYKIRGVLSVFEQASASQLKQGVLAASAGNMGQAVAYLANKFDIPCHIYVPDSAPEIKKQRMRSLGANLIELPFNQLWKYVTGELCPDRDGIFIHPARTPALFIGYEKIAEEIIDDLPELDALVIPFGLGGLSLALSRRIKQLRPSVAIYTCEPDTAAPLKAALLAGYPVPVIQQPSFVDAIGTPEVLPEIFSALQPLLADSEVVPVFVIEAAVSDCLAFNKLLCEGAAACALAAAKNLAKRHQYQAIACILTGGNLNITTLQAALESNPVR